MDAIDSRLPHTADNVQWVCLRINLGNFDLFFFALQQLLLILRPGKNTSGDAEFRAWAEKALRVQGDVGTLADIPTNAFVNDDVVVDDDDDAVVVGDDDDVFDDDVDDDSDDDAPMVLAMSNE